MASSNDKPEETHQNDKVQAFGDRKTLEGFYAEGASQSVLSPAFQKRLVLATTAEEALDLLDRQNLRISQTSAVLNKLLLVRSCKARTTKKGGSVPGWQAPQPEDLLKMQDFKDTLAFQNKMLGKLHKFLGADILIQSTDIGSQLETIGMVDEGRQMSDMALVAIENALQPDALFVGGFGFRAADLPKILASRPGGHGPIRRSCLSALQGEMHRHGPDGLMNVVASLLESKEKLQAQDRELLADALKAALRMKHILRGPQLAEILYNSALLDEYNGDLMEVAAQKAARNIGLFGAEDLGKLAFAVTRFDFEDRNFLGMLAQAATWKADKMSALTLSRILLCFAHFGFTENPLAFKDAVRQMETLRSKRQLAVGALSDSLKALAQLKVKVPQRFLENCADQLASFALRVSGALARQKQQEPEGSEVGRSRPGGIEAISTAAAAFSAMQFRSYDFTYIVQNLVMEHTSAFTFRSLANLLWSLATEKIAVASEVVDVITVAAVQLPKPLPQDLVRMAWAFARLGKPDAAFIRFLKRQVQEDMPRIPSELLPDLAWALLQLQAADESTMMKLVDQAREASNLNGLDWMTLILAVRSALPEEEERISSLVSRCATTLKGKLRQQGDLSIQALDGMLSAVKLPEDAVQFGEDVMNEVTRRGLDNSATRNGEPLFTKEGTCLHLLPNESRIFWAI